MKPLLQIGRDAKTAAGTLAILSTVKKNEVLAAIARQLEEQTEQILDANQRDLQNGRNAGMREALLDRLALTEERIRGIAEGVRQVITLPDPVGKVTEMVTRPNGLQIGKKQVPLGVIAIIYEARPNVTADAAALTLKSGNAVILRGGKEAIQTNIAIAAAMQRALQECGIDENAIQLLEDTSRQTANELMQLREYIDVLIPRGGAGLIHAVVENASVPVIETGTGNCHIYIDESCDETMACEIVYNAKTQRPSVCNAAESLLVCRSIAPKLLPKIKESLDRKSVQLRGCPETVEILRCDLAEEEDFYKEYNDYILSVKVVSGVDEAIAHINKYGTGHSEAIVTKDYFHAQKFLNEVDAAAVYVNASTRFTDGFEFGFGAEIGISTQKLHARGPMGLNELTTTKYIIYGNGQTRK